MAGKKTLVVLTYFKHGAQGREIQLALKGWRKFCQFDYHFVVIGEFDNFLRGMFPWVEFIKCPKAPLKKGQYNPHLDIQNRMKVALERFAGEYDGFVWMADDWYAIKPFELDDITTVHYNEPNYGKEDAPCSYWSHDKWKTHQLLAKENLPQVNYTIHYPYWYEDAKLKEIWDRFNMLEESYVLEDVYFNYFSHSEPVREKEVMLGVWNKDILDKEFQNAVDNPKIKFVANSVEGWSSELENALERIINE